jgi:hypothetical protein
MRYRGVFRWFRDDTIMLGDSDLSVVFASLCYFQNFQFDFFGSSIFFLQFGEIKQIKMGENRNNMVTMKKVTPKEEIVVCYPKECLIHLVYMTFFLHPLSNFLNFFLHPYLHSSQRVEQEYVLITAVFGPYRKIIHAILMISAFADSCC